MKKIYVKLSLCLLFFILSPIIIFLLITLCPGQSRTKVLGESKETNLGEYFGSLPEEAGVISSIITSKPSTPIIIGEYLKKYNSPLFDYTNMIIEKSTTYGIDPRLIVAIAQQESNLGKNSPPDCFNAWGWGIHKKGTKCYGNWEESIESVTKGIAMDYCSKGWCDDPCVMMKKYTPSSNGSWCFGIKQFLYEMETGTF